MIAVASSFSHGTTIMRTRETNSCCVQLSLRKYTLKNLGLARIDRPDALSAAGATLRPMTGAVLCSPDATGKNTASSTARRIFGAD